jgi:hypothetical protein
VTDHVPQQSDAGAAAGGGGMFGLFGKKPSQVRVCLRVAWGVFVLCARARVVTSVCVFQADGMSGRLSPARECRLDAVRARSD